MKVAMVKKRDRRYQKQPSRKGNQDPPSQIRPRNKNTVHLDGSTLEGGGQLVRVALSLSALTRIPVHITNIRAGRGGGRNSGGLKESHLAALEALAEECGASVDGGYLGSKELLFEPAKQKQEHQTSESKARTIELQKPGSVWLILQALLPWYLLQWGRTELTLRGGTNVSSSMSGDYVQQVLLPLLEKLGLANVQVDFTRGWAGNAPQIGEARISIHRIPIEDVEEKRQHFEAFTARDRGSIAKIVITVVAHPQSMRNALILCTTQELARKFPDAEIELRVNEDSDDVRRLYILLVAQTSNGWRLGRDYLGTGKALKNQKETDALVEGAVRRVVDELSVEIQAGGCVDEYMQDQLVVFQALAAGHNVVDAGKGRGEGTLHTRTVRWVCCEMLGGLGFESMDEGMCRGIGRVISPQGSVEVDEDRRDGLGWGIDKLADRVEKMNWEVLDK